jgi:hypothetical protein
MAPPLAVVLGTVVLIAPRRPPVPRRILDEPLIAARTGLNVQYIGDRWTGERVADTDFDGHWATIGTATIGGHHETRPAEDSSRVDAIDRELATRRARSDDRTCRRQHVQQAPCAQATQIYDR